MLRKIKKKQTIIIQRTTPPLLLVCEEICDQRQTPVFRNKFSDLLPLYYAHLWSRPDRRRSLYIYYHYYHYIVRREVETACT